MSKYPGCLEILNFFMKGNFGLCGLVVKQFPQLLPSNWEWMAKCCSIQSCSGIATLDSGMATLRIVSVLGNDGGYWWQVGHGEVRSFTLNLYWWSTENIKIWLGQCSSRKLKSSTVSYWAPEFRGCPVAWARGWRTCRALVTSFLPVFESTWLSSLRMGEAFFHSDNWERNSGMWRSNWRILLREHKFLCTLSFLRSNWGNCNWLILRLRK